MSSENTQLVTGGFHFEPVKISPAALAEKESALADSALIGKVENRQQNEASSKARKNIKAIAAAFEKCRRELTDPALEYQRMVKRVVDTEKEELLREDARLEELEKTFLRAEMRRAAEEAELQRKELERIENARLAELKRIADEQAAREAEAKRIADEAARKEREAAEAAARLVAEATNKQQRESAALAQAEAAKQAEANRIAREQQEAVLKLQQATAALESQRIQEAAETATRLESKPPELTRAHGQVIRKKWKITQINDMALMKARPDLIRKIEWDMLTINQELAEGKKLAGVTAVEDFSVGNRGGKPMSFIEA